MSGEKVRELREARSWTQQHLAEAAELSLRTVQRLETAHSGSAETMLAIAGALGVEVGSLSAEREGRGWLWPAPPPRTATLCGALLVLPVMLFVGVNLLKFGAGIAAPYDLLASLDALPGAARAFELLSPPLFVGGPLIALGLALLAQIRPQGEWRAGGMTLTGVEIRFHPAALALAFAACASLAILLAYLAGETLTHLATSAG
jgi:DNA-binding XRE family transcriptional regulator